MIFNFFLSFFLSFNQFCMWHFNFARYIYIYHFVKNFPGFLWASVSPPATIIGFIVILGGICYTAYRFYLAINGKIPFVFDSLLSQSFFFFFFLCYISIFYYSYYLIILFCWACIRFIVCRDRICCFSNWCALIYIIYYLLLAKYG